MVIDCRRDASSSKPCIVGPYPWPARMVKFDPEGFKAMMGRIAAEDEAKAVAARYEELEPDYEYMTATARCCCPCH